MTTPIFEALKELNCEHSRDVKEIKIAYKKLAINYHPDTNLSPDATDKFKKLTSAYDLIERYIANGGNLNTLDQEEQVISPPRGENANQNYSYVAVPPGYKNPNDYILSIQDPTIRNKILENLYKQEVVKHIHRTGYLASQSSSVAGYNSGLILQRELDLNTAMQIFNRVFNETANYDYPIVPNLPVRYRTVYGLPNFQKNNYPFIKK